MRSSWKAGRATISCSSSGQGTQFCFSSGENARGGIRSPTTLLFFFFSLEEVVTWLCSPALALFWISFRPASAFTTTSLTSLCGSLFAEQCSAENPSQVRITQRRGGSICSALSSDVSSAFLRHDLLSNIWVPHPALPRCGGTTGIGEGSGQPIPGNATNSTLRKLPHSGAEIWITRAEHMCFGCYFIFQTPTPGHPCCPWG